MYKRLLCVMAFVCMIVATLQGCTRPKEIFKETNKEEVSYSASTESTESTKPAESTENNQYKIKVINTGDLLGKGTAKLEQDIQDWLDSNRDKTIKTVFGKPEQGGLSQLYIVYSNDKPDYRIKYDIYYGQETRSVNSIDESIIGKYNTEELIAMTEIPGWRGGIVGIIVFSKEDKGGN